MSREDLSLQIRKALGNYDDPQQPVVLLVAALAADLEVRTAQRDAAQDSCRGLHAMIEDMSDELAALKAVEPVAWVGAVEDGVPLLLVEPQNWKATPLYASPQPSAPDWRQHSVQFARGEKCPPTLETAQAAWARDQELIEEQRAEIARHKQTINQLRQRRDLLAAQSGVSDA